MAVSECVTKRRLVIAQKGRTGPGPERDTMQITGRVCRQKHSHRTTDPKIGPGGEESQPGTKERPETPKTHINSGTLPRPKWFLFSSPYRTTVERRNYTCVFNTWFSGRPEIVDFWGLGGPDGPKKHSRRWGGEASHLLEWLLGPPGPPRPQKSANSGRPKNRVLKTQVHATPQKEF